MVLAHYLELAIPGLQCKAFWFWTCQRWSWGWENSCIYPSDGNLWLCSPGVCDDRLVCLNCLYHLFLHYVLYFISVCFNNSMLPLDNFFIFSTIWHFITYLRFPCTYIFLAPCLLPSQIPMLPLNPGSSLQLTLSSSLMLLPSSPLWCC